MLSLWMTRGKRRVFIGYFPSKYRARNVASNLEWGGWRWDIQPVEALVPIKFRG